MGKVSQFEFLSYFALFELPEKYQIDFDLLKQRYKALQRQYHPDRFAHKSEHEQRVSLQIAAYINEAYATLTSPVKRAHYLLERCQLAQYIGHTTATDSECLMLQIELREEQSGLDGQDSQAKQRFLAKVSGYYQEQIAAFSVLMDNAQKDKEEIIKIYYRLQFFAKLLGTVKQAVD